jgi:hypothetical protein
MKDVRRGSECIVNLFASFIGLFDFFFSNKRTVIALLVATATRTTKWHPSVVVPANHLKRFTIGQVYGYC